MNSAFARSLANGLERWLRFCLGLCDCSELHVRIAHTDASIGFCVSHVVPTMEAMDAFLRCGRHEAMVAFLGSMATRAAIERSSHREYLRGIYAPASFRLVVTGWKPQKYLLVSGARGKGIGGLHRCVVEEARTKVEGMALVQAGIVWTLFDSTTNKFIFKSLKSVAHTSRALEFFGGVPGELVVPLQDASKDLGDEEVDGWTVSGYAVLPPVGHPSRARQRVYINSMLVEEASGLICDRIDSLYREAYRGAARMLPWHWGSEAPLRVVRQGLNAHAMFIIDVRMVNEDARREFVQGTGVAELSSGSLALLPPGVEAAVERAFSAAWSPALSEKILNILDVGSRHMERDETEIRRFDLKKWQSRDGKRKAMDGEGVRETLFDDIKLSGSDEVNQSRSLSMARTRSPQGMRAVVEVLDDFLPGGAPPASVHGGDMREKSGSLVHEEILMPHTELSMQSNFFLPTITAKEIQGPQPGVIRTDLTQCKVLGQIERKFIAFHHPESNKIGIIDQHAADERIRLEYLQRTTLPTEGGGRNTNGLYPSVQSVQRRASLRVGNEEHALFINYYEHANSWGWRWEPWCPESKRIVVTHVPMVLGKLLSAADLKLFVHQLSRTCTGSQQSMITAPSAVHRVLASVACRGAIMFGDELGPEECNSLVHNLSKTIQFYECAHGRPTCACLWVMKSSKASVTENARRDIDVRALRSKLLRERVHSGRDHDEVSTISMAEAHTVPREYVKDI
jgi:DNA mismatch repair ATPase MutL